MKIKAMMLPQQHVPLKIYLGLILICLSVYKNEVFSTEDPDSEERAVKNRKTSISSSSTSKVATKTQTEKPRQSKKVEKARGLYASEEYASEEDVELIQGKLPRTKNKQTDNYFWNVFYDSQRAGKVSIDLINSPPLGEYASIQIFLNKGFQGKGIGRIAYRRACELSHYDVVYATMRKNNIASFKAAQAAGFTLVKNRAFAQCVMKWVRR